MLWVAAVSVNKAPVLSQYSHRPAKSYAVIHMKDQGDRQLHYIGIVEMTCDCLKHISEAFVVQLRHIMHSLLNCVLFISRINNSARSLSVSFLVDGIHVDVQGNDHR